MNIHVIIFGTLLRPEGEHDYTKAIPEGSTVKDLMVAMGYQPAHVKAILTTVNGQHASPHKKLHEGDEVVLSVMVGGG
jgi:sulfur carrier protein ThiS